MVDSGTFKTSSFLQEATGLDRHGMSPDGYAEPGSPASNGARRHIDPSAALEKLDICFGGFFPTSMGELGATYESLLRIQEAYKRRRDLKRSDALTKAELRSDTRTHTDEQGFVWSYAVIDDASVSIERCELSQIGSAPETGASDGSDHASIELVVPDMLDGYPVMAIEREAMVRLEGVVSIVIPDNVTNIGECAFRDCSDLVSISYPKQLDTYSSNWTRGCSKLADVRLPGMLEKVTPQILDAPSLRHLVIGAGTVSVMPGAFIKSGLESIEVSSGSETLMSDGSAVYSADGLVMWALAVPCESYDILDGCKALARKAFSNFASVRDVGFPDSLELIGDHALAKTGIESFTAPSSLKVIGERAFFGCTDLESVKLDDGLLSIGSNAFSDTAISELRLPSSIVELGYPIATGTSLTYSGEDASFSIDEGDGQRLILDSHGVLYSVEDDGLHLVRSIEPSMKSYDLDPRTVAIDDEAFAKHPAIESVTLNDGLIRVGRGAFKGCRTLGSVNIPDTVEEIGDEAFLDTSLRSISIPSSVEKLGSIALVTYGSHLATEEPTLASIEVDSNNPKYRMEGNLLLERMGNGKDRIILCESTAQDVVIPETVTAIASYALNGIRHLDRIVASDRVVAIDVRGIAFDSLPESIVIEAEDPEGERKRFEFDFPETSRAAQQIRLAFGSPSFINIETVFDAYDNSIVSRTGFGGAAEAESLGLHEQARRIVDRLEDPVYMSKTNRGLMDSVLRSHIVDISLELAKHDDRDTLEGLLELGFIDEANIGSIIDAVGAVQDASMTNYLLEQKRRRFSSFEDDFEL